MRTDRLRLSGPDEGNRGLVRRALLAALGAAGAVWLSVGGAGADDPEVCGFFRYGLDTAPTSTAPGLTYCDLPCGSALVVTVPSSHVNDIRWEGLVCVKGV